jgi:hypothetical protein
LITRQKRENSEIIEFHETLSMILECMTRNLAGGEKMGMVIKVMRNISLLVQNGGKEENKEKREKEKASKREGV